MDDIRQDGGKDPSTPLRSAQDDSAAERRLTAKSITPPKLNAPPAPPLPGGKPGRFWELKEAADRAGVLQLYIYGDVEGSWYDWWTGTYHESETSAEYFRQELGKYPQAQEIEIFINSYGGEVFEGTAIYNQLKRHPAHKTVYIDGFACSIASVIAMAGDEVIMPRNTLMMIHNMWMGAVGNAAQLRKAADDLDTINAAGRQAYLQKAGDKLSEEKLAAMMDAETWLTAEECVALGLADRFAEEEADLEKAQGILQRVNDGLQRQVTRNRELAAALREATREDPSTAPPGGSAQDDSGQETDCHANAAALARNDEEQEPPSLMAFLAGVDF